MFIRSVAIAMSFFISSFSFATQTNPETPAKPMVSEQKKSPKINLNQADVATLAHSVKGIGLKRAEAIIKYREENKGFKSLDELAEVRGIGANFVKKNHDILEKTFVIGKE